MQLVRTLHLGDGRSDDVGVPDRVQRLVAAVHANRCAHPRCSEELIRFEGELARYAGELAHIRSPSRNGPRYDATFPRHRLDEEDNLLAACEIHHTEFDRRVDLWPTERLLALRERAHARRHFVWKNWLPRLAGIHYANVPRLMQLAAIHGVDLDLPTLPPGLHRDEYPGRFLGQLQRLLPRLEMDSIRLTADTSFGKLPLGIPVTFARGVRTLNGPRIPRGNTSDFGMTGDLRTDPQVYMARSGWRITLPYDPQWLTSNTAFADMSGGNVEFAGAFIVKRRLSAADDWLDRPPVKGHLIATPLVLGFSAEPFTSDLRPSFSGFGDRYSEEAEDESERDADFQAE